MAQFWGIFECPYLLPSVTSTRSLFLVSMTSSLDSNADPIGEVERYGRLIRLKSKYRDQYVALHRHPFPEILDRIRASGFRNYSIFLRDGLLFSYNEYVGDNLEADMEAMAENSTMQDWWTLTDPMQEPLAHRDEGEWWAMMDELYHGGRKAIPSTRAESKAFLSRIADGAGAQVRDVYTKAAESLDDALEDVRIQNYSVYLLGTRRIVYFEYTGSDFEKDLREWHRQESVSQVRRKLAPLHESLTPDVDLAARRSMDLVFYMT